MSRPLLSIFLLEAVDAVKLLHADIRETGEDSHVETALVMNKLSLTMDCADDLRDIMPAAPVVANASPVATEPSEETTVSLEFVATETARVEVKKPEEQEVQADPSSVTDASAAVSDSAPELSEVLTEMQEGGFTYRPGSLVRPDKSLGERRRLNRSCRKRSGRSCPEFGRRIGFGA